MENESKIDNIHIAYTIKNNFYYGLSYTFFTVKICTKKNNLKTDKIEKK